MTGPTDPAVVARKARARALVAGLWALGAVAVAALTVRLVDDTPSGRVFATVAVTTTVGVAVAALLVVVNLALAGRPGRRPPGGAADLLCLASLVLVVVLLLGTLVLGRPFDLLGLGLAAIGLLLHTVLGLDAVATSRAARTLRAG